MANGRFVNDYSFLNLPELGSAVRSPIAIAQESLPPSVLEQIDFSARRELPQADLLTRGVPPISYQQDLKESWVPKIFKIFYKQR